MFAFQSDMENGVNGMGFAEQSGNRAGNECGCDASLKAHN